MTCHLCFASASSRSFSAWARHPHRRGGSFSIFSDGLFLDAPARVCLVGNSALRRAIERQGYSNVYLNVPNDNRIQVRATRGKWVYLLQVNHCTGRVLDGRRLRPA